MRSPTARAVYACLYPVLCGIAKQDGYALAVHSALSEDLDLVAVPWASNACEAAVLVQHIVDYFMPDDLQQGVLLPEIRPHGRLEWTIHVGGYGTTIDLSVMPRSAGE